LTLGLAGSRVRLEPFGPANQGEVEGLTAVRETVPVMGGPTRIASTVSPWAPPMLIRDTASGRALGTVESGELSGYEGVAVLVLWLDTARSRPGQGLEAYAIYVTQLFEQGARLVHVEVLDFNNQVLRLLRRVSAEPQARLRRHAYVAGRFWDLLVFAFDADEWRRHLAPFLVHLRGAGAAAGESD
jgi:L-amino acid N-acyltransferase YncA